MLRILKDCWMFYLKLVVPSFLLSLVMGSSAMFVSGTFSFGAAAFAYILFSLLFHYFIYEIRDRKEYYFYYNLGLSKPALWVSTFLLSSVIGIILLLI